jgi:hypothetical protein
MYSASLHCAWVLFVAPPCSIRPTMIGTQAALGVGASTDVLLFVICSPVGPYYKTGFKPVSLLATTKDVRAWPGGTGGYKVRRTGYPAGGLTQSLVLKHSLPLLSSEATTREASSVSIGSPFIQHLRPSAKREISISFLQPKWQLPLKVINRYFGFSAKSTNLLKSAL